MTRFRPLLIMPTLLCLLVAAGGCTGSHAPLIEGAANNEPVVGQLVTAPFDLPAPLDLAQQQHVQPRRVSEIAFIGFGWEGMLPNNRVAYDPPASAMYTPDYTRGGVLAGAAYAIYSFTLEGNAIALQLPADAFNQQGNLQDLWIGFANFTHNRWDWFQVPSIPGAVMPPNQAEYVPPAPATDAYMALVFTGHDTWSFYKATFGNDPPIFDLLADVTSGTAPLEVNFTLDIYDPTTVQQIEWDLDGDGVYEIQGTPADTAKTTTYSSRGLYDVSVRVTDNLNTTVTHDLPIAVNQHLIRTWGTDTTEKGTGVAVDDAGNVYVCGDIQDGDGLLLKFDPQLELLWSKKWNNGYIARYEDVVCIGDDVYVTGVLVDDSTFPSNDQILLHRYDGAGNLLLQKSYGDLDDDDNPVDLATDGTALYLTGATWDDVNDGPQLLVAKFLNNLAVVWGKTDSISTPDFEYHTGVAVAPWDNDKLLLAAGSGPAGVLNLNAGDGTIIWQKGLIDTADTTRKFAAAAVAGGPSGPCLVTAEGGPGLVQFDAAGNILNDYTINDDTFCASGALVQDAAGILRWAGGNTYDAFVYRLIPGETVAGFEQLDHSGTFYGRGYNITAQPGGVFFVTGYADLATMTTWKRDVTAGWKYEDIDFTASSPGFAFTDWGPNMADTSAAPADVSGVLDTGGDADSGNYDVLISKFVPAE